MCSLLNLRTGNSGALEEGSSEPRIILNLEVGFLCGDSKGMLFCALPIMANDVFDVLIMRGSLELLGKLWISPKRPVKD